MEETQTPAPTQSNAIAAPGPKGFQPGHPRFGGRKKGTVSQRTRLARDIAAAMKFDPIKVAIRVIEEGVLRNKDGSTSPVPEERLKLLRDISQYIQPKLTAVQVTGKDDGPVNVVTVDIAAILRDPAAAQAAQSLAMAMALADADRPAQIEPAVIDVAVEAAIDDAASEDD
jgi:hypothetical protein